MLSPEILSDFSQSPVFLSGFRAFRFQAVVGNLFFPIYLFGFVDSHQGATEEVSGNCQQLLEWQLQR